jgi:hypothetical protein
MKLTHRLGLPVVLAIAIGGCALPGSPTTSYSGPSAPAASPSASGVLLRALWILSPVGLSLRNNSDANATVIATVPQGTQVTATEFRPGTPGWYHVTYNGSQGWIADRDTHSSPPQALVTARAQLAYSNPAAGYYFLYPAAWSLQELGNDVLVEGPVGPAGSSPGPEASNTPMVAGVTPARLKIHLAATVEQLGAVPTSTGANLDSADFEVGGFTALKRTFSLGNGGYEGDVKVRYSADHAVLISLRSPLQADLDILTGGPRELWLQPGCDPDPDPDRVAVEGSLSVNSISSRTRRRARRATP